jgi:hypothetical protein
MRQAPRIPRDRREPIEPHFLAKQLEVDQRPGVTRGPAAGVTRTYLLVDEVGCACIANGVLTNYVQDQVRDAVSWFTIDERLKGDGRHVRR